MKRIKKNFLDYLKKDFVIGAEGYVFELERRGLIKAGPFVPEVVLDYPGAVLELHREFLRAGAQVAVALTYYAQRNKLEDVGRAQDLERLNRQAVRLARKAANEYGAWVAGNICNTWAYDPKDKKTWGTVEQMYREQVRWAAEEGADFIISETNDYLGEALIALKVIKEFKLPAMVTLASVQPNKTRDGYDYVSACQILEKNGADIVGLNCTRGPKTMLPIIKRIRKKVSCFIAAQPVPYRTTVTQPTFQSLKDKSGVRVFPLKMEAFLCDRFEMAEFAKEINALGVNYIGICCGGAPYYVRAMAEALGRETPSSKYSPAMDLHPVLGQNSNSKQKEFLNDWQD